MRLVCVLLVGLFAVLSPQIGLCFDDAKLGTAVSWEKSPKVAFGAAAKEKKLVLLVHLSGNFDNADET